MQNSKAMKIVLAVVLVLVLIFLLMQCSGGSEDLPAETTAPAVIETTEAAETAPVPAETEAVENEDAFTDSVTQKGEPAIQGNPEIRDMVDGKIDLDPRDLTEEEKDTVVSQVPAEKRMMVAFARRAGTETQEGLEAAYMEILKAETLASLNGDMAKAAEESGMDLQKLVVRDLVDIALDPEYDALLKEEQNYLALTFDLGMAEGEKLIAMTRTVGEDGKAVWQVISGNGILYNADGTVTVAFEQLCPVALVVEGN